MNKPQLVKTTWLVALTLASLGLHSAAVSARPIRAPQVQLNGQPLATSVAPVQFNGRTLVPMRDIFEALGANVQWNGLTRGITAQKDTTAINLQINNHVALINGRNLMLDQAPILYRGATMVPLRFVSEALGAQVQWNGAIRLVSITTPNVPPRNTVVFNPPVARPVAAPATVTTTTTTVTTAPASSTNVAQQPGTANPNYPGYIGGNEPTATASASSTRIASTRVPEEGVYPDDEYDEQPERDVSGVRTISVPQGAVVPVRLDRALSSATARVGDTFTATVVSQRMGDSEFPAGSKIEGTIIEARPRANDNPGVLDLDFRTVILPNGRRVPIQGQLIGLDNDNVSTSQGRIMARERSGSRSKVIGTAVGAGVGFVLGKVFDKNTTVTTGIGAIGGYIFGRRRDKQNRVAEAVVPEGTRLGVSLMDPVSYTDTTGYADYRMAYLRNDMEELRLLEASRLRR